MVRDDVVRSILWAGAMVGFVSAAASAGDYRHLRCVTFGGAALAVLSCAGILRSVFLGRTCPAVAVLDAGEVTGILEAPTARRAADNAGRITELAMRQDIADDRLRVLARLVHAMGTARGQDGDDYDATGPMRCLSVVREDQHKGGAQAGLCAIGRAAAVLAFVT